LGRYGRPGETYEFSDEKEKPDQATIDYVQEQWSAWIESLQTIPGATWVNHPKDNHCMESKIRQLRLAHDLGFNIPETVVTTSGENAVEMFNRQGGSLVSKALSSPLVSNTGQDEFVFSVHLEEPPSEEDESLEVCPTIFQEALLPKTDYRATVVGDTVFSVRIEAEDGEEIPVDWRTEKDSVRFVEKELPPEIEDLCREYVDEAGLLFGAIDLVKVGEEFVFLEINPNGEWGWLQKPWGVPIAENLTEMLIEHDKKE